MREEYATKTTERSGTSDELEKFLTSLSYRQLCQEVSVLNDCDAVQQQRSFRLSSEEQSQSGSCRQIKEDESKNDLTDYKRKRTMFTPYQLTRLEEEFRENMYVVGLKRWRLATELCLSEKQVKIWFQNRRMKLKREHVKTKCLRNGFPWY